MKTTPALLAAMLALSGLSAFAAEHDHASSTQGAGPAPSAKAKGGGCKMMMKKKGGNFAKEGEASGKPGMCAGMAQRHGALQGPVLEPALPPGHVAALGLDAGQRERLAALEKQNRIRQWALLGELREERLALAEALAAPDPDPAVATARLRAVQDVEARLLEARLVARREALATLTPEQRARLAAPPQADGRAPAAGHDHGTNAPKDDDDDDEDDAGEGEEDPHAAHR